MVEGVGKALVEAVERRALAVGEGLVSGDRVEESSGEWSVDAVEEFQEDQADRISFGQQTVAAGAGQLFDKAFGAQLGEIVSKPVPENRRNRVRQKTRQASRLGFLPGHHPFGSRRGRLPPGEEVRFALDSPVER